MKCPFLIKVCTKCGRILVAYSGNFHKMRGGKYGLRNICILCRRRYQQENKEEIAEYQKQYYKENKEECNKRMKKWYEEHKEEIAERNKQYYEEHKEEIKEKKKQYRKNNPYIEFNKHNKRRTNEENQGNGITKEQWYEMMGFFNWKCAYSGEYLGGRKNDNIRTIDHIIALNNGGVNEIWNCVPMLKSYNSSKNTKDMLEWYTQQPFFSEERLNKIYEWVEYAKNKWDK